MLFRRDKAADFYAAIRDTANRLLLTIGVNPRKMAVSQHCVNRTLPRGYYRNYQQRLAL